MPKYRVNADAYTVLEDNPVPNQPPLARALSRGEVYDFTAEEAERGRNLFVVRHYASPAGPATVARREPALVEATDADSEAERRAEVDARLAELRDEVARLEADHPPAPIERGAGFVSAGPDQDLTAPPVTLTPAQTGVRMLDDLSAEPAEAPRKRRGRPPRATTAPDTDAEGDTTGAATTDASTDDE